VVNISKAKDEDKGSIMRLYLEFNDDRVESGVGDAQYKYIEGEMPWAKTLTDTECVTLVAKERGMVLGFITLRIPEYNPFHKVGRLAEVDLLVVEKKLRRRGVGSYLYTSAQKQLKSYGVTHVLLNVKVGNVPAMIFWTKMGFKKVSGTDYKRTDGIEEKTIYMMKKI
jgi:ribosomal protein S18 acetylase RimI-like enzyme